MKCQGDRREYKVLPVNNTGTSLGQAVPWSVTLVPLKICWPVGLLACWPVGLLARWPVGLWAQRASQTRRLFVIARSWWNEGNGIYKACKRCWKGCAAGSAILRRCRLARPAGVEVQVGQRPLRRGVANAQVPSEIQVVLLTPRPVLVHQRGTKDQSVVVLGPHRSGCRIRPYNPAWSRSQTKGRDRSRPCAFSGSLSGPHRHRLHIGFSGRIELAAGPQFVL